MCVSVFPQSHPKAMLVASLAVSGAMRAVPSGAARWPFPDFDHREAGGWGLEWGPGLEAGPSLTEHGALFPSL